MSSIEKVGYQAQVIPALLAGLTLEFIETRLKRIVPNYLYLVVVPVCSLILAVFLAHTVIGPFGRMIGDGVAFAVRYMMTGSFAPIGAAALSDENSVLYTYQKLIALRKTQPVLIWGDYQDLLPDSPSL